jgi:NADPH:quinone reductase-like Zn-dependent oxidoreductase
VNPVDVLIRTGRSLVRMFPGRPVIPGLDVAGVVDQIGPGTETFLRVGDHAMAMVNPTRPDGGGYAELVVLDASWVVRAPDGSSDAQAATVPANGLTALRALDLLELPPQSTVAVTGAAGAVGGYAVELARVAGHQVIADAAPADAELVNGLGADIVVPRGPDVADAIRGAAPDGVDAVIDAAVIGADIVSTIRAGGRYAAVRSADEQNRLEAEAAARGVRIVSVNIHDYDGRTDKLDLLRGLADEGRLTMRVATVLPPDAAAAAHRAVEAGGVRGRMVLSF